MRLFILGTLASVHILTGSAQNAMKRSELAPEIFITPIQSNGIQLLSKYVGASIAFHTVKKDFILYGEIDAQSIIFLERFGNPSPFYPKGFTRCVFENGTIKLCSTPTGKALEVCAVFGWENEHLVYKKEEINDPGKSQTARGLAFINAGQIAAAIQTLDSVKMPDQYFNTEQVGVALLRKAYQNAQALAERRKFKDGIAEITLALRFKSWAFLPTIKPSELKTKIGKSWHGLDYETLGNILCYVGELNNSARQYDAAIQWHQSHQRLFTEAPRFYKLMGDAYYGKRDRENYQKWYQQYIEKMKQQKKEKHIESIILQRAGK